MDSYRPRGQASIVGQLTKTPCRQPWRGGGGGDRIDLNKGHCLAR